jgi:hypothetical protein
MALSTRPFFRVDYMRDRALGQVQPTEVTVRQKEYAHDVVVLRYTGRYAQRARYKKGQPVTVQWGWAPKDIETFNGYVHSTKIVGNPDGGLWVEVYCVGPSYAMDKTRMRTHKAGNIIPIVRSIAREYRFTLRNTPSSRMHRPIAQMGRSDFKLLCDLAREIGFTLHVKRTEVQFIGRGIDARPNGKQATFRYAGGFGPVRNTLYSFTHRAGSAPLARNRRLVMGGIDDNGKAFWATEPDDCCDDGDAPTFTEYLLDAAPTSVHEGMELLSGLNRMNRFYVMATVMVSGAPKVRCGETIRLSEVGNEVSGYWWTGAVTHKLMGQMAGRPTSYRMEMELGRETIDQVLCITEEPPASFSGKPVVQDDANVEEPVQLEVPTVFSPTDDCMPIEQPVHGKTCHCKPKACPGSTRPLPTTANLPARLDRWGAVAVARPKPTLVRR